MSEDINVTDGTVLESLNNKVDLDGGNYTGSGLENVVEQTHWSKKITNCLLEVPQRVKLELNDGVLTLKAGSQVIVPNGFEEDGVTPRFDYVDIERDISYTEDNTMTISLFYSPTTGTIFRRFNVSSGTDASIESSYNGAYYSTDLNYIKNYTTGVFDYNISFPLAVIRTTEGSGVTSIEQVFNGLGYIGSTVWVDKGVKGLIPNGRNEDGTLRNIEWTTQKLYLSANQPQTSASNMGVGYQVYAEGVGDDDNMYFAYIDYKVGEDGYIRNEQGLIRKLCIFATYSSDSNKAITSFNPKQPFRAIDYSDSSEVSGWGMPSNKYIDLTLGASGTTYTAPANGWIVFCKLSDAANQYLGVGLNIANFNQRVYASASGQQISLMSPVNKNANIYVAYSLRGDTKTFRFYYAEGETN